MVRVYKMTPRQREIAFLVAQGKTNREIASRMKVTVQTIKTHLSDMYGPMRLRNRTELAIKMTRQIYG